MKKILAIAVATAISAPAMADMTISGSTTFGWIGDSLNGEGFGTDGSSISVSGSEALENGLTFSGAFGFENGAKGQAVAGTGSNMAVAGDFGTVKIVNGTFGPYTESFGTDNFVGEFGVESNPLTVISYTAPAMGPVTLVVDTAEGGVAAGAGAGAYDVQVTALVKAGAFSGRVAYKNYDSADNRVRVGGSYDLGVAKVGASFQMQDNAYDYTSYGVSVPMGATTIGLSASKKEDTTATPAADMSGTSLNVSHALSSNVTAAVQYDKYDTATGENTRTKALVTLAF